MDNQLPPTVVAFRRRHRLLWLVAAALVLPSLAGPSIEKAYEWPSMSWLPVGFGAAFVTLVLVMMSRRCPACNAEQGLRPLYCHRCEAPLLPVWRFPGSAEPPRLATRQEWKSAAQKAEVERRAVQAYRSTRFAGLVMFAVCVSFVSGILEGIGDRNGKAPDSSLTRWLGPDAPRWASIGIAVACALLGWGVVRASYGRYLAAGASPENARLRSSGLRISAGALMMALGLGGLVYSAFTAWPPADFTLWIALSAYTLAGWYVLLHGMRFRRGGQGAS